MPPMPEILTLEFAAQLTPEQEATVRHWLALSRPLWNFALGKLIELDEKCVWSKDCKSFVPVGHLWADRAWKLSKADQQQGYGMACPLRPIPEPNTPEFDEWMPLLKSFGLESRGGLSLCSSVCNLPFGELRELPSAFRMGVLAMLDTSWKEWRKSMGKGTRGKPKFKRKDRDEFRVLYSRNLPNLRVDGDRLLGLPKVLGPVKVPGLSKRWKASGGTTPKIATVKIVLSPDGNFRIQLAGNLQREYPAPPSNKAIGIDPGIIYRVTHSDGWRRPENKESIESQDAYVAWIQQQIDRKVSDRFWLWVAHPERTKEDVTQLVPLSQKSWDALSSARTKEEAIAALGNHRYQIVRHKLPKSNAQKRLEHALRKYKRKQQARRKAERNSWATRVAKKYGAIAIETGLQSESLRKKGNRNSKRLSEAAPGANIEQLERMATRYGRHFVKVDAAFTTIECPVCGELNEPDHFLNDDGDRLYVCSCCNWECDQDISAAVNVELMAHGQSEFELTSTAQYAKTRQQKWEEKHPAQLPTWRLSPAKQKLKREADLEKWRRLKEQAEVNQQ